MRLNLKRLDMQFVENGHTHILNKQTVPGCSSIAGVYDLKSWAIPWGAKVAINAAIKKIKTLKSGYDCVEDCYIITLEDFEQILACKNEWRNNRDKAQDFGVDLHHALEVYIKDKIAEHDLLFDPGPALLAGIPNIFSKQVFEFLQWEKDNKVEWIASELQVGSEEHEYAGILDLLMCINGKLILGDIKTSKGIHANWRIQLCGLKIALEEMGCPTIDEIAILHFPRTGAFQYVPIACDFETEKRAFLTGLKFYKELNMFKSRTDDGSYKWAA